MTENHSVQGALWMVLAGACFAIVNTMSQYLSVNLQLHSTVVGFFQYFISFIVMLPWIITTGLNRALKTKRLKLHVIRVILAVIGIQFWLAALAHPVPIWQAIALIMTSPLFVIMGSAIFLREKVGFVRWLATLIGFSGSLIILAPWQESFEIATLLPVAAAFFWAAASLMIKFMADTESEGSLVIYLLILIAPFNFFLALPNFSTPTPEIWVLLLVSGALVALAQWSIAKAYIKADASYIQPFDLVKLPLNVFAGWLVFSYVPPGELWLGSALIVGATLLIFNEEKHQSKISPTKR
ncbi:MAG: DMT family transporter [Proteobacteria bacterium]|nr:DMT family transporter [Pseudomonadota bacterium]